MESILTVVRPLERAADRRTYDALASRRASALLF